MKETPNVITIKDLLYIEDMMNWNLIMNKKINELLDIVEDEEIKSILKKTQKMHSKHFKDILDILE